MSFSFLILKSHSQCNRNTENDYDEDLGELKCFPWFISSVKLLSLMLECASRIFLLRCVQTQAQERAFCNLSRHCRGEARGTFLVVICNLTT